MTCILIPLVILSEPIQCWNGSQYEQVFKSVCSSKYEQTIKPKPSFFPIEIEGKVFWICDKEVK